jgi:hypothetical protein
VRWLLLLLLPVHMTRAASGSKQGSRCNQGWMRLSRVVTVPSSMRLLVSFIILPVLHSLGEGEGEREQPRAFAKD